MIGFFRSTCPTGALRYRTKTRALKAVLRECSRTGFYGGRIECARCDGWHVWTRSAS